MELVVGEEPEDVVFADGAAGGDAPLLAGVGGGNGYGGDGAIRL